jgi:hypothetical protein
MNWTHEQLRQLGYRQNADGSFSHSSTSGIPHAKPQPAPRPALDDPPKREDSRPPRTRVRIERKSLRLLDADNFAGGCKPLIDQLRYANLIADDDPETIEILFQQVKVKTKKEEMTTIEITRSYGDYKRGDNDLVKTSFD